MGKMSMSIKVVLIDDLLTSSSMPQLNPCSPRPSLRFLPRQAPGHESHLQNLIVSVNLTQLSESSSYLNKRNAGPKGIESLDSAEVPLVTVIVKPLSLVEC